MPIGLGILTWWRFGAISRTYGWETFEPPVTQNAGRRHYFGFGHPHRRDHGQCLRFVGAVDATGASDSSGHDPHPSRVSLEAGRINRMATRHVELVGRGCRGRGYRADLRSSGWTVGCVEPRHDETTRRRDDPFEGSSAGLQFELQRHLQIHPLRDFVFVVAAGAGVVGTKVQTPPHARWPWA